MGVTPKHPLFKKAQPPQPLLGPIEGWTVRRPRCFNVAEKGLQITKVHVPESPVSGSRSTQLYPKGEFDAQRRCLLLLNIC